MTIQFTLIDTLPNPNLEVDKIVLMSSLNSVVLLQKMVKKKMQWLQQKVKVKYFMEVSVYLLTVTPSRDLL